MTNYLDKTADKNTQKSLFVLGYMNANILDLDNNDVLEYKMVMASLGLESLINEPTRVTNISQTCIDYVYARVANKGWLQCKAEVLKIHGSLATVLELVSFESVAGGRGGQTADCPSTPLPRLSRSADKLALHRRLVKNKIPK